MCFGWSTIREVLVAIQREVPGPNPVFAYEMGGDIDPFVVPRKDASPHLVLFIRLDFTFEGAADSAESETKGAVPSTK